MANSENVMVFEEQMNWSTKACRSIFLKLLSVLPEGQMTIKERGSLVAVFGDKQSPLKAEVNIVEPIAYRRLLLGGSVASGETYTDGLWTTPNLTNVIRVFARNLPTLDAWESKFKWLTLPSWKIQHLLRRNSKTQAKKNISAHYDLGNELYTRFLDPNMQYSSAIYATEQCTIADAQENKLRQICDKLNLSSTDHLLEIGTGWGGLAIYAAKHYGCKVTTTTISDEQHAYATEWVAKEGLSERIILLKKDYRDLEGKYDKLVSIEMIEAVGKEYLNHFFKKCSSLLKSTGLMVLQAITIDDRRYDDYASSVDFIQKHIFPGGFLPSQFVINKSLKEHTDMMIRDVHDIGLDYARTLRHWSESFHERKEELADFGYDERFARLWQYYFSYCEGGFLERTISTVQLVMSKANHLHPISR